MNRPATGQCGLYVHVPFCTTKCGYCDFYSIPLAGEDTDRLVRALRSELFRRLDEVSEAVTGIFVGGGTPTVLRPEQLAWLLEPLAQVALAGAGVEFTVEANPATVDPTMADTLVRPGVTRLSLGAQSFQASDLAVLERIHSPDDIKPAVRNARQAGIGQINLDLIFGVPGQTMPGWLESLDRAIALEPDHLALYGLTYEPGTALTRRRDRGQIEQCDDGFEADAYLAAIDRAEAAGLEHYEISNFARSGCRCRQNLLYWRGQPYVGVGPSAAGCVDGRRYRNVADLQQYVDRIEKTGIAVEETESIDGVRLASELVMLGLRLVEGLDLAAFERRTGLDARRALGRVLDRYLSQRRLTVTDTHVALTRRGFLIADTIMADLMGELDQVVGV
ncbi:MAG: radical SAM family heme chaperone HemW [bacterium]|nr:radical SAM family heme chaperone HemW [bacterium]